MDCSTSFVTGKVRKVSRRPKTLEEKEEEAGKREGKRNRETGLFPKHSSGPPFSPSSVTSLRDTEGSIQIYTPMKLFLKRKEMNAKTQENEAL